jgi:hypothetical protein
VVPSAGQKIPVQTGWYLPQQKNPLAENRFLQAGKGLSYGLVTKSLGAGCTFEEVAEKIKCQKMNVNFLTTKVG